jgi:hypothetical protein
VGDASGETAGLGDTEVGDASGVRVGLGEGDVCAQDWIAVGPINTKAEIRQGIINFFNIYLFLLLPSKHLAEMNFIERVISIWFLCFLNRNNLKFYNFF